ncbi:MAG: hypothetical protein JWM02_3623 [Frankiales bacterium]|nr:hypothetical protein [Frankiales bacterium]
MPEIKFFIARDADGFPLWLLADPSTQRPGLYCWVSNTGQWHRNPVVEMLDMLGRGPSLEPVQLHELPGLTASWPELDAATAGWLLDEFEGQQFPDVLSNGHLGIVTADRDAELRALTSESHTWAVVRSYPAKLVLPR